MDKYVKILICIVCFLGQAQNVNLFSTKLKNKILYVEQTDSIVKVYVLKYWYSKFELSTELLIEDILKIDNKDNTYTSTHFIVDLKRGKLTPKTKIFIDRDLKLKSVKDKNLFYNNRKDGYWWMVFFEFESSLQFNYQPRGIGFHEGFSYLNKLKKIDTDYENFKVLCNQKIEFLKDSLASIYLGNAKFVSDSVLQNVSTIDSKTLYNSLLKLPIKNNTRFRYFQKIIDSICTRRPELLFELVEIAPELKEQFCMSILCNKQNYVALKRFKTNSTFRTELIKRHRRETRGSVIAGSTIIILEVLIITGIVYLIVK